MGNSMIRCTAVMLAAGMGLRMGTDTRKQYLMLGGMPMFLHSIRTMQESEYITDIIVMAHKDDLEVVRKLLEEYGFTKKLRKIAVGGKERVHSVANGLEAIDWPCDYVFIHDCARPFLDQTTLFRLFETVQTTKACCAGVPAKDTVKVVDENCDVKTTPNRADVWIVQTPQVFSLPVIRAACESVRKAGCSDDPEMEAALSGITDDARMVSLFTDTKIKLVMGSYENIKVTTPVDLIIAERILEERRGHIS